jgi:hypothetical protein
MRQISVFLLIIAILGFRAICFAFFFSPQIMRPQQMRAMYDIGPGRAMIRLGRFRLKTVFLIADDQDAENDPQDAVGGETAEPNSLVKQLKAEAFDKIGPELFAKIEVELMIDKVNPYKLMTSPLPSFTDRSSSKDSTTKAVDRMDVQKVELNVGFKAKQRAFTLSIKKELEFRKAVDGRLILTATTLDGFVSSESDIGKNIYSTTFIALNRLFDDVMSGSTASIGIPVKADGVSY